MRRPPPGRRLPLPKRTSACAADSRLLGGGEGWSKAWGERHGRPRASFCRRRAEASALPAVPAVPAVRRRLPRRQRCLCCVLPAHRSPPSAPLVAFRPREEAPPRAAAAPPAPLAPACARSAAPPPPPPPPPSPPPSPHPLPGPQRNRGAALAIHRQDPTPRAEGPLQLQPAWGPPRREAAARPPLPPLQSLPHNQAAGRATRDGEGARRRRSRTRQLVRLRP